MKISADISDMASLSGERSEARTAVMALAKVAWKDATGASYAASVTIENTSTYGACIRTKAPIGIGSRLRVDWRGGRFFGVAKYCRSYREEFIVGIQRECQAVTAQWPALRGPAVEIRRLTLNRVSTVSKIPPPTASVEREITPPSAPTPATSVGLMPTHSVAECENDSESDGGNGLELDAAMPSTSGPQRPSPRGEKTSMLKKWLSRALWHERMDTVGARSNWSRAAGTSNDNEPSLAVELLVSRQGSRQTDRSTGAMGPLLQLEDIYRAKGIIGLRMGYSISKVAEMLRSDHVRELPIDVKRASILIALDLAGIPVEEVLEDADRRLDALNSYEADQEKHVEEYEARKVQENAEIQTEMGRVTAHYLERLKCNMDDVAQVRSPFAAWRAIKEQEAQRITEAVELCAKRPETPMAAEPTTFARTPRC